MDPIKADQMVLCVPFYLYPVDEGAFRPCGAEALSDMAEFASFERRGFCETNEKILQLIPYCVVRDAKREKVLLYRRPEKGGDARLTGRHSVGVGGHVEAKDWPDGEHPFVRAITSAASREMDEEIRVGLAGAHTANIPIPWPRCPAYQVSEVRMLGLIHDCSDAVGRVHLGVLLEVVLHEDTAPAQKPDETTELRWATPQEALEAPNLESWSGIALRALAGFDSRIETP